MFRNAIFFCFLISISGWAQNQPEKNLSRLKSRIFRLESEAKRLELRLKNIKKDSTKITDELNQLELERAIIAGKVETHELELTQAEVQIGETEKQQLQLREKSTKQQRMIGSRLRQIYKRGNLGYAQLFLKESRLTELINAYHYARILTERDNLLLQDFKETHRQLDAVKDSLNKIQLQAEEARVNMLARQSELKELMDVRTQKLKEIKRKESRQRRLFKELELEREELELMVRRLTEDDANPWELRVPISKYRRKLSWPANGKILRRFGIISDPEFHTKRPQNGLDIAVPKGKPVRAVYSGRVLYADWFKNYGNLIIIDHGEKITSFYAHCEQLLVAKGDFIERDQVIASSGDSASLEGPMLHFEIREKTKAVDPLKWLKPKRRR